MKIEILFPEFCNLFGDTGNVLFLKKCLPEAQFFETPLTQTPHFANEDVDLIYMGPMSERAQEKVIKKLLPFRERILQLANNGVAMLFCGNACEIFANYIETPDKEKIEGLKLFDFYAKRERVARYNGFVLCEFEGFPVTGFKSQFTYAYGDNESNYFAEVKRGMGLNKQSKKEGFRLNNMILTYLLGPILVLNPRFSRWLLDSAGAREAVIPYEDALNTAFEARIKEFRDPKVEVE